MADSYDGNDDLLNEILGISPNTTSVDPTENTVSHPEYVDDAAFLLPNNGVDDSFDDIFGDVQPNNVPHVGKKKRPLHLLKHQIDHNERMENIIGGNPDDPISGSPKPVTVDTSNTGLGKTPNALALCAKFNARFIVIGPAATEFKPWEAEIETYSGLQEYLGYISYNKLSGARDGEVAKIMMFNPRTQSRQPVALLRRQTEIIPSKVNGGKPRKIIHYTPTPALKIICGKPRSNDKHDATFFILDEFQALKNRTSNRNRAFSAIARYIRENASDYTRMIFLSATPFDKEENARGIAYAMGFIRHPRISTGAGSTFRAEGLNELVAECMSRDYRYKMTTDLGGHTTREDVTGNLIEEYSYSPKNFKSVDVTPFIYRLMTEVIFPKISSAMPPMASRAMTYRGFFNISHFRYPASAPHLIKSYFDGLVYFDDLVKKGVEIISEAFSGNVDHGVYTSRHSGEILDSQAEIQAAIIRGLTLIEAGCIHDMCEFIWKKISAPGNELHKGIVAVNYTASINYAIWYFAKRGIRPDVIAGHIEGVPTPPKYRGKIIDNFQNNDNARVLIMNMTAGAQGISLHDRDPRSTKENKGRKRWMVMSAEYDMIKLHQTRGRIDRTGTRSIGEAYLFYPMISYTNSEGRQNTAVAANILDSLARKSVVTNATLHEAARGLIPFPGDYPRYIEPIRNLNITNPQTGAPLPTGGFLDESALNRKVITLLNGETREVEFPITDILEWIAMGAEVRFTRQETLEVDWEEVAKIDSIDREFNKESGETPPSTPSTVGGWGSLTPMVNPVPQPAHLRRRGKADVSVLDDLFNDPAPQGGARSSAQDSLDDLFNDPAPQGGARSSAQDSVDDLFNDLVPRGARSSAQDSVDDLLFGTDREDDEEYDNSGTFNENDVDIVYGDDDDE